MADELNPNTDEPKTNWVEDFGKRATIDPNYINYVPLPTNTTETPTGSVYAAHLRQENTIGSFINRLGSTGLDDDVNRSYKIEDVIDAIPPDLRLDYSHLYLGRRPGKEVDSMTAQIRQEQKDKSLLRAYPWRSMAYNLDPLEPTNWLWGGEIYKGVKTAASIGKSMISTGLSAAVGSGIQEAVLQQTQETRTLEESFYNTMAAGVVGGALGALGASIGKATKSDVTMYKARINMTNEVSNVYTETPKVLTAEGMLTPNDLKAMPELAQKGMRLTPMGQMLTSPFETAKSFGANAYEHNFEQMKHSYGFVNENIEGNIKLDLGKASVSMLKYQDIYYDMHGIAPGRFQKIKSKLIGTGGLNKDQFDDAVSLVLTTETEHPNAHVNKAANLLRKEIFDKYKDMAVELKMLPEDVTVRNAVNYFTVMYNKAKIIEQGGSGARGPGTFPQYLHDQYVTQRNITNQYLDSPGVRTAKATIERLNEETKKRPEIEIKKINDSIQMLTKDVAKLKAERLKVTKPGKVKAGVLSEFDKNIKAIEEKKRLLRESKAVSSEQKKILKEKIKEIEKKILDDAPDAAKNWEGKLHKNVSDEILWSHVTQTVDNIIGNNEGSQINPMLTRITGGKPLKTRKLLVDQAGARPWHVTNAVVVAQSYLRAMVPAIKLTEHAKKLDYKDIADMRSGLKKELKKEFDVMNVGVRGKDARVLQEKFSKTKENIDNTIDLLLGVYGSGDNVLSNSYKEYLNNFRKWNYTRLLGHMTLSSMADAGSIVFTHGVYRTYHDGLMRAFTNLNKFDKTDLQAIGMACETMMGSRIKSMIDHAGLSIEPGVFSKGLDALTQNFGNLSLMNPWNDVMQTMAGTVSINRTLQSIAAISEGKAVSKKEITRLAKLGINEESFEVIHKFAKDNVDSSGARYADWTNWDIVNKSDAKALREFQNSVRKEIENTIVIPGLGDKPLIANTELGKLLLQFKTFAMGSTNRLLYAGIQRNDAEVYQGVVTMMSLGALSYMATSFARGNEPDTSFGHMSREALDRSGLLGVYGEALNIGQKAFHLGEVSRYQTRDIWGSLVGPSGGAISEMLTVINKIKDSTTDGAVFTTKDAEKIMRLVPLQNLFYLHKMNREINKSISTQLGALPVD